MAGSPAAYALLPAGTANDFARALGIPRSPLAAARMYASAHVAPVATDLLRVGDRYVCTVIGTGIVADSALAASRLRAGRPLVRRAARLAGASIYRLTATAALVRRSPLSDAIELGIVDDARTEHVLRLRTPGLFVATQPYLGGGLRLPSITSGRDGIAEALVIHDVSRLRLIDAFTRLTLGAPIPERALAAHRVTKLTIRAERALTVIGDGDALTTAREIAIDVVPGALRVLSSTDAK